MKMPRLNIDLGELPDEPEALWTLAELANVACGGHAGDDDSMAAACLLAKRHGAMLGAHPSYEDRANFGRRSLVVSADELEDSVRRQCARLVAIAKQHGVEVQHVKPHGALYHDASRDPALARAVVAGARAAIGSPAIVGPPGSQLLEAAREAGLAAWVEGFADRGYRPDGTLVPRTEPGALLTVPEEAAAQARRLADSGRFDTLCIHSDTVGAVEIARAVREALSR